ncbi:hypothetical protein LguiA_033518 [Lonicera macranthoides]
MADSAVSFLLDNISQLLKHEASMLVGVEDDIKSLYVELIQINQFLQDSKGKREMVKDLVSLIRNVAHRAENVIDRYVINMAKHKRRNMLKKFWHSMEHTTMLRNVAKDIQRIKREIETIYSGRERYRIEDKGASNDSLEKRRALNRYRSKVEEIEVVGFVNDFKTVMDILSKTDLCLDVISIVGMGGIGKTTLAKKIYNSKLVKERFDCCAWVNVSQEFETKELLLNILRNIAESTEGMYNMNEDELAEETRKLLQGMRYFIVLDDVWDTVVWDGIKDAFPDNLYGCRILVTSRLNHVALHLSRTPPYSLRILDKNNSWELFSKKAFHGEACPPGLENYGRKMVEKCNGLPLAIVVLAGQLAQRSPQIWSRLADDVRWYIQSREGRCLDILALSYEELPPHLRPCFLYFGMFPERFEITARLLIRLWIAEGFIKKDQSRKVEDVADKYLEDLVDRNLVMVSRRRCDGGVKSCFIHDFLHDLCIFECQQENFSMVLTAEVFTSSSASTSRDTFTWTRRLSTHCSTSRCINFVHYNPSEVHSFLCFGDPCELSIRNFDSLNRKFQLLRVLDLGSTTVLGVPTKVEELIHLRYLRMNAPQLSEIPSCISNLPKLQTLDLRESKIKYFTKNFWEMQRLRHLFVSGDCDLPVMHRMKEVKPMHTLKTLSTISSNAAYLLEGDTVFPNLRKLGLQASRSSSYSQTKMAKPNFSSVRILKIMEGAHFLSHEGALPSSLTKLTLLQTKIKLPVFEMLAKLPNLEILKLLKRSLAEESIDCKEGWFPALQVLYLVELDLKKWTFQQIKMQNEAQKWITHDRDLMQSLRYLLIRKCRELTDIPEELKRENVQYEFQS